MRWALLNFRVSFKISWVWRSKCFVSSRLQLQIWLLSTKAKKVYCPLRARKWPQPESSHYSKSIIFCPKIQFGQNHNFINIWNFAPKLQDILEYFNLIEFSCQKSRSPTKIELTKQLNFGTKNGDLEQCVKLLQGNISISFQQG